LNFKKKVGPLKIWELLAESGRADEKRVIAILVHGTS
jgi:hypothetical protein